MSFLRVTRHTISIFFFPSNSTSFHLIMSNSAEIASTSEELSEPFDGINTGNIIPLLLALPAIDCPEQKLFFKTYKKWDALSVDQKSKTVAFWQKLSDSVRHRLTSQSIVLNTKDTEEEKQRQANANKHDFARIIHLKADVNAHTVWCKALREKDRATLDSRNSENAAELDPWNQLAEMFNNYEGYKYQNAVVDPTKHSPHGIPVANTGMENLLKYCHDINPSAPNRPIRDGGFIRQQWSKMKGVISKVFTNYHLSGNQEAENVYDEWEKFSPGSSSS